MSHVAFLATKRVSVALRSKSIVYIRRFNYLGSVSALLFYAFSVFPSLLPRPWLMQAVISGLAIAIGYGCGVLASTSLRWIVQAEPRPAVKLWAKRVLAYATLPSILLCMMLSHYWQEEVRKLVGMPPTQTRHTIFTTLLTLTIAITLLQLGRGIRRTNKFITTRLDHFLPIRLSMLISVACITVALWWLCSGLLTTFLVTSANNLYRKHNSQTPPGITQPDATTRSGSNDSYIAWNTLGYQGKKFVATGPSTKQLQGFYGTNVQQPIRIYAGVDSARTPTKRAELAVAELKRTHAFERKVLILATPTGTGWLQPEAVDSIEYMYGGNTAIVAQQYSYLPSWISFLVDKDNAREAGVALFDAVYDEWVKLPAANRPKLITYGLSLGSFGGQAPYRSVRDIQRSVDGALFVGTPNSTQLWRDITAGRERGSLQRLPRVEGSKTVHFTDHPAYQLSTDETWKAPRTLYLQHASDPVVWLSADMLLHKPDWLSESYGPDVSKNIRWFPVVTGLQVALDQFVATTAPNGHGHNYANEMVDAWAAVAQPANWNTARSNTLKKTITP